MYALKGYADLVLDLIRSMADNLTSNSDKMVKQVRDLQTELNTTQIRLDNLCIRLDNLCIRVGQLTETNEALIKELTKRDVVNSQQFTHELTFVPEHNKIHVIKLVRQLTGWGLKESKAKVEAIINDDGSGIEHPITFRFKDTNASYYRSDINANEPGMASELFKELGCVVHEL